MSPVTILTTLFRAPEKKIKRSPGSRCLSYCKKRKRNNRKRRVKHQTRDCLQDQPCNNYCFTHKTSFSCATRSIKSFSRLILLSIALLETSSNSWSGRQEIPLLLVNLKLRRPTNPLHTPSHPMS